MTRRQLREAIKGRNLPLAILATGLLSPEEAVTAAEGLAFHVDQRARADMWHALGELVAVDAAADAASMALHELAQVQSLPEAFRASYREDCITLCAHRRRLQDALRERLQELARLRREKERERP